MEAPMLRPLGVGENLDVAFRIYRRHAGTLFRIVLFVVLPIQALGALILVSTVDDPDLISGFSSDGASDVDGSELWGFIAGNVVINLLGLLATLLATAACVKAVGDAYLGRQSDWKESLGFATRRAGALLWLTILTVLLLIPAFIALILPGIWLAIAWTVAFPVLLIEGVKGRKSLGRSFRLVKGRWWATFAVVAIAYVLASVFQGIVVGIASAVLIFAVEDSVVGTAIVNAFANTLAGVVATPLQAAVVVLVYFDLRVRKEGLDIQLLAQDIGAEEPPEGFGAPLSWRPPAPPPLPVIGQEGRQQPPPPPPGQPPPSLPEDPRSG